MENENRIQDITGRLTAFNKRLRSQDELERELSLLRRQIIGETYGEIGKDGEYHSLKDVVNKLSAENKKAGNPAEQLLKDFSVDSKKIVNQIKAIRSGNEGERIVKRSLETIKSKAVVLKNICLEDGDHKSEIDFIVLTEKAIFLIEVKNPHKDILIDSAGNYWRLSEKTKLDTKLGEKMNEKLYLLRKVLYNAGIYRPNIEKIVVFSNSLIQVTNNYEYIRHCFIASLPNILDNYEGEVMYTTEELNAMSEMILKMCSKDDYHPVIDIEKYKREYAAIVTAIEEANERKRQREREGIGYIVSVIRSFFERLLKSKPVEQVL